MNINEEYAMEMLLGGHLKGKEVGGDIYIVAYMHEAKITNPECLDRWLLANGYLRKPTAEETISRYKVTELKEVLSKMDIKVTGKKAELVERILSNLPESEIVAEMSRDKRYFLSEKGLKHYHENIDLIDLHKNWIHIRSLEDYFKYRKENGTPRGFYETAYLILENKIKSVSADISDPNRWAYVNFSSFSEICEKLGMYESAVKAVLIELYLATNLAQEYHFYLNRQMIQINGVNDMCHRLETMVIFAPSFTQKIVEFSQYYSENMVDDIYKNIALQYIVFEKQDFKATINDMLNNACFEAAPYREIIKANYKKVAKHILRNRKEIGFSGILKLFGKKE